MSRKRPVHRLGDLLPGIASQLGLNEELDAARAVASWTRIVEEQVPAAAGASQLLEVRPPSLIVSRCSLIRTRIYTGRSAPSADSSRLPPEPAAATASPSSIPAGCLGTVKKNVLP